MLPMVRLARFLRPLGRAGSDDGGTEKDRLETQIAAYADTFSDRPPAFFLQLLGTRRGGQDVLQTLVGYVCTGRGLEGILFFHPVGSVS